MHIRSYGPAHDADLGDENNGKSQMVQPSNHTVFPTAYRERGFFLTSVARMYEDSPQPRNSDMVCGEYSIFNDMIFRHSLDCFDGI